MSEWMAIYRGISQTHLVLQQFLVAGMLQDTCAVDGTFSHAFKAHQLKAFVNDIFARGQKHEEKHHPCLPIVSVLQVSCSSMV